MIAVKSIAVLLVGALGVCACTHQPPVPHYPNIVDPERVLDPAHVRDTTVLATRENRGGAAIREAEYADYLYGEHFFGIEKQKNDETVKSTVEEEIYSRSKDRSIYAKPLGKHAKKKSRTKKAKKTHPQGKESIAPLSS